LWQPALHLPNRVALARKRALAYGTATNLLVTAAREDPDSFANTPMAEAVASGAFIPRFSFAHIHPEVTHARTHRTHARTHCSHCAQASLAVASDGASVNVCGMIDAVPGFRMIVNSRVVPSTFPARYTHLSPVTLHALCCRRD
jgi:hypothetical protein